MKELILADGIGEDRRRSLEERGYTVTEVGPEAALNGPPPVAPGTPFVLRFREGLRAGAGSTAGEMVRAGARVVLLCESPDGRVRDFAFAEGIADVLVSPSAPPLYEFIGALGSSPSGRGRFILMDDGGPLCSQAAAVVERFGYALETVSTEDAFFTSLEGPGVAGTMCNLGSKSFDVGRFVKRCAASMRMKGLPCVPYKDPRDGFFVHEFISGLNRVARVIMSPPELLGFLVSLLFRVELARLSARLDAETCFEERNIFREGGIPGIYQAMGMDIFTMGALCAGERFERMAAAAEDLRNFFLRCRGLGWLAPDRERVPTCGPGV